MKLGLMQPYFLPYIGYFQLLAAVDVFVIYDNIKYTKKGWINRNRFLLNGTDALFSIPLKKDSDSLDVSQRYLATDFDRHKLLNKFSGAYKRAPFFEDVFPLLERIVHAEEDNLFSFVHNSIVETAQYLGITTQVRKSSAIGMDHELKGEQRVLATCAALGATTYVNAIGGTELYSKATFSRQGIDLKFVQSDPYTYPQFSGSFVPHLSIVDVMMFNDIAQCRQLVEGYSLA